MQEVAYLKGRKGSGEFQVVVGKPDLTRGEVEFGSRRSEMEGGASTVTVFCHDKPRIFAALCTLFDALSEEGELGT